MARTNEWTETLVDWVDGRLRQNRFANMWLGGGAGTHGGSSYRPIDGQLTQRHVCYDTSEDVSPCSPSGFSSLVDNLRRIRYWQEPATWFGVETTSGLQVYIKPGLWYPSTTEYCAFAGGDSPTFTLPGALDRIDTVYIDASGILHIQRGTPAVSPTITLPPIASGIPLWAVYLPPTASGVYFQTCSGYYAGQAYIERDLRPFLNLGGGGAVASGVLPGSNRGSILRGQVDHWETYNVGTANEVLTNDGTDVIWSTGAIDLTAGKTLVVSVNLTLAGVDGKSLTIEENSTLNQDLTTDASVTFADVFIPDGGTFGISGNELLTVNAAGNFTFSGVTSIVVPDGAWVGADADCAWLFNSTSGYVTTQDTTGVGTAAPEGMLDVAYGGYLGKMTLLLGADMNAITRTDNISKRTLVGSYHYTNVEEPVGMMYVFSSSIVSRLDIGGGSIYCNAATQVSIYTAANTTTPTGTERFRIDSTGAITIAGPSFTVPAAWNLIVPDNVANALSLIDSGAADVYLQIVTTTGSEEVVFNAGVDDVDFTVQAVGVADALQVQGSDGQITLGVLTAGFVKSDAGGILSVVTEAALADLADYAQGRIIRGGAADWEALAHPGTAGYALISDATNIVWDQTPAWTGEHSFAAGIAFTGASGANEITMPDNIAIALELLDAGGLEYMRVVSTNANPYFIIDPGATGFKVGIGCTPTYLLDTSGANPVYTRILSDGTTAGFLLTSSTRTWALKTSTNLLVIRDVTGGQDKAIISATGFGIGAEADAPLDVATSTATTNTSVDVVHIEAVSTGDMVDNFGPRINFAIKDGAVVTQHIASLIARRDGADNSGGLLFAVKNAGTWNYTTLWLDPTGRVGIGLTAPTAKAHIDQPSTTAAIPVLTLDQADISEGFINFIGSDRGVIAQNISSLTSVRVELGGVVYRLALYVDA